MAALALPSHNAKPCVATPGLARGLDVVTGFRDPTDTPGYKLDYPGTAGNCASCYAPAAAIVGDNRIPALASDTSTYTFAAPAAGPVTVTAELRFRRLFRPLLDDKGWDPPDIVMA